MFFTEVQFSSEPSDRQVHITFWKYLKIFFPLNSDECIFNLFNLFLLMDVMWNGLASLDIV